MKKGPMPAQAPGLRRGPCVQRIAGMNEKNGWQELLGQMTLLLKKKSRGSKAPIAQCKQHRLIGSLLSIY